MRAHDPASAQIRSWAFKLLFRKPKSMEHFLGFGIKLRIVQRIKLCLSLIVFNALALTFFFQLPQSFLQSGDRASTASGHFQDRFFTQCLAFLRQIANGGPFVTNDFTGVGHIIAQNERKEGCFS